MAKKVFYSFYYDEDVWRVQQIRNIGSVEGQPLLKANEWEEIRRKGTQSIQNWINDQMNYKDCVIVLIGEHTADREWVQYEVKLAKAKGKPMLGIYIHNIKDSAGKTSNKGKNPFDVVFGYGKHNYACYEPRDSTRFYNGIKAYDDIGNNIESWYNSAVQANKINRMFGF